MDKADDRWQRYRYTLGTLWNVIGDQLPVISILVTFIFHTKVFGHNLNASTAFVALTVYVPFVTLLMKDSIESRNPSQSSLLLFKLYFRQKSRLIDLLPI